MTLRNSPYTVVSFYCGDDYYYRAAERLREDCLALGLDHHIVEAPLPRDVAWIAACRYKVRFIAECLERLDRPILWIDADCRILARPELLEARSLDFAFFLRGFRYIKDYDPVALPRMAQPSILYIGNTQRTRDFVALMAALEAEHGGQATDDFFLQEAWLRFDRQLSMLLLPPELVCFELPARSGECFFFGRSHNAAAFKDDAEQHEISLYTPARRKAVLVREAGESLRTGQLAEAEVFLRRAHQLDPGDEALAHRIARVLRRQGRLGDALEYLRTFQGTGDTDHVRRFLVDSELSAGNIDRAEQVARELTANGSEPDRAWARSRQLRIGLDRRARQRGIADADRPRLWWLEGPYPGNFGDLLNPYIVERLSGRPPLRAAQGQGILAIGSTIKFAREGTTVWGTGTPRMSDRLDPRADYRAVRGPLTRELVIESGGKCPPVYGDPSWFLPRLYRPAAAPRTHRLGLVLHHHNVGELVAGEGVKPISVLCGDYDDIERFIDALHECECVLSTSLHGLIVAHAYGIPARWCVVPDSAKPVPGDGTKFRDYLLSVGLEDQEPVSLPKGTVVTERHAREAQQLPRRDIDLDALAAAAPFDIVQDWQRRLT